MRHMASLGVDRIHGRLSLATFRDGRRPLGWDIDNPIYETILIFVYVPPPLMSDISGGGIRMRLETLKLRDEPTERERKPCRRVHKFPVPVLALVMLLLAFVEL